MKKYLRHKISNLITIGEINVLEYRNYKGKFSKDTDSHDFWEICYVEKGQLECLVGEKKFTLFENNLLFLEPNTPHIYLQKDNNDEILCIGFECLSSYIKPLSGQILKTTDSQRHILKNLVNESNNCFFTNSEEQLVQLQNPALGCMQIITLLLEHLVLLSLRELIGKSSSPLSFLSGNDFYSALTDKLKQYCIEHLKEKISLDDVCKKIGYSKSFVCKLFKEQTGKTVFEFFNFLKVEHAKKLLISTAMTATQISDELSFSDPKYFNSLFKKHTGFTPVQFRKLNVQK